MNLFSMAHKRLGYWVCPRTLGTNWWHLSKIVSSLQRMASREYDEYGHRAYYAGVDAANDVTACPNIRVKSSTIVPIE